MLMSSIGDSSLWTLYQYLRSEGAGIAMRKVGHRKDIFPVFHDIFKKKGREHARP
jgi:hypothetical protein